MIADIKVPDSRIVRQAEELVRGSSSDMLFNHVMRCYWFAELFAQREGSKADRELMFLSATLHDLGFTELSDGPHRFEIEGANAARKFLLGHNVPDDRAWKVWDNIALHTWDINLFKDDTARLTQLGLLHDVVGVACAELDPADVAEVLRRYPRLGFKRGFHDLLCQELDRKQPYEHFHHASALIAHGRGTLEMPDLQVALNGAPFDD